MTRGPLIERASCHWFSPDLDPRFSALCPSPVLSRRPSQAVLRVALAGLRRARVVVGELDSSHEALHLGCDMRVGGGHRAALVDEEALGPTRSEIGRAHVELQSLMRTSYDVLCLKKKH